MNIALYYPWIYLQSGAEKTILETLRRSKHRFTIFTNHYDRKNTYSDFDNLRIIQLKKIPVRRDLLSVIKATVVISLQKIDLTGYDAMLVHSDGLGDLITLRNNNLPVLCFCHSPLRPVFDNYYRRHLMETKSLMTSFVYSLIAFVFKLIDKRLWNNYVFIFFSSKETLRRAKEGMLLGKTSNNYEILHPGIDYEKIKKGKIFKKYFIVPGRIMWAKNIELAINAFKIFSLKYKNYKLIIAGQVDKKSEIYFKYLKSIAEKNGNIIFQKTTDLYKLISESYCVVFPSFNEDWGILPIEANATGKAVIAVKRGGFVESQIAGKTGLLTSADPMSISDAMIKMVKNKKLWKSCGNFARKNAKKYDWKIFISKMDKILDKFNN